MADVEKVEFVAQFLDQVTYAIERNITSVKKPLVGDIDIIIQKQDILKLIRLVDEAGLLISATTSYGGARLFLGESSTMIKRIDCMWNIHYRGIPLDTMDELLAQRIIDSKTGFYVLPEAAQARIAWTIKNAYGGAEKYRELLENNGYDVLDRRERLLWLISVVLKHPLASTVGSIAALLAYMMRLIRPTGLIVSGISVESLRESRAICYLFQNRIRGERSIISTIFRSRILSELCITSNKLLAELDLSDCLSILDCEKAIIQFLKLKRSHYGH